MKKNLGWLFALAGFCFWSCGCGGAKEEWVAFSLKAGDNCSNLAISKPDDPKSLKVLTKLKDWEHIRAMSWSPDGKKIAAAFEKQMSSRIVLVDTTTGKVDFLGSEDQRGKFPAWSPDGGKIAFTGGEMLDTDVWVVNPDGSDMKPLAKTPQKEGAPVWSPDGRFIVVSAGVPKNHGEGVTSYNQTQLFIMKSDGSDLRQLTKDVGNSEDPMWSHDGKSVAFTRIPLEKESESVRMMGAPEIFVINADGSGEKNLTNHKSWDRMPVWSPDGKKIAFVSSRDNGNQGIFVMNADGSDPIAIAEQLSEEPSRLAAGRKENRLFFLAGGNSMMMATVGKLESINFDGSKRVTLGSEIGFVAPGLK